MKKIAFYTLGCRANQAEIQEWIIDLEDAGYQLTSDLSAADFGILNTCSVTERAEKDIFKFSFNCL